jgi:hypothetical protein
MNPLSRHVGALLTATLAVLALATTAPSDMGKAPVKAADTFFAVALVQR